MPRLAARLAPTAWTLLIALLTTLLLLAPDYLYALAGHSINVSFRLHIIVLFFGISLLLALTRSAVFAGSVLGLLCFAEITQFAHLAYFRDYLSALNFDMVFVEAGDFSTGLLHAGRHLYYAPFIAIVPYTLIAVLLHRTAAVRPRLRYAPLVLILVLAIPAYRVLRQTSITRFMPNPTYPSLYNTLTAYSLYFTRILPRNLSAHGGETVAYEPYSVTRQGEPKAATIVIILGESINPRRLGVLGYERMTTPRLQALKDQGGLIAKPGIAAGVVTRYAMPFIFNVQREPRNMAVALSGITNLFRLAKRQGFATYAVSAQQTGMLVRAGIGFADALIAKDHHPELFEALKDEAILELAKTLPLTARNFVVLHQFNAHYPYEWNYAHRPRFQRYPHTKGDFDTFRGNTYDNAMLYNDFLHGEIIDYFSRRAPKPLYVFITSDHGQPLGEDDTFGHAQLSLAAAQIPFLLYSKGGDPAFLDRVRRLDRPTHYESGLLLAELLGYEIENPQAEPGIFFINGAGDYGSKGVLRIDKSDHQAPISVSVLP